MTDDPARIVRSATTRTARFDERADGIIVQRLLHGSAQTIADAQENIEALLGMIGDDRRGLLFDARPGLSTDAGVRDTYAKSEGMKRLLGIGMVISSTAGRIAGNFLIAVQVPSTPTRLFNDEASALAWLHRISRARR